MVAIELSKKDAAVLMEILEYALEDLKTERVRTDNREYHSELTQRETLLRDIIGQLQGGAEAVESG